MPSETLDTWKEAVRKEVEHQAFIDASLGLREFRKSWTTKREKDQHRDCQGRWKRGGPEQRTERDPDAMDVDAMHVQGAKANSKKERQRADVTIRSQCRFVWSGSKFS